MINLFLDLDLELDFRFRIARRKIKALKTLSSFRMTEALVQNLEPDHVFHLTGKAWSILRAI